MTDRTPLVIIGGLIGLIGGFLLIALLDWALTICTEEATTTCTKWCQSYHVGPNGDVSHGQFECGTETCRKCVAWKWRWE